MIFPLGPDRLFTVVTIESYLLLSTDDQERYLAILDRWEEGST